MRHETMSEPESNQPEEKFPETHFGEESLFEFDPVTKGLKSVAKEEKKEPKGEKKEVPSEILEAAEEYAKNEAYPAPNSKEAGRIGSEAYQKFLKERGY